MLWVVTLFDTVWYVRGYMEPSIQKTRSNDRVSAYPRHIGYILYIPKPSPIEKRPHLTIYASFGAYLKAHSPCSSSSTSCSSSSSSSSANSKAQSPSFSLSISPILPRNWTFSYNRLTRICSIKNQLLDFCGIQNGRFVTVFAFGELVSCGLIYPISSSPLKLDLDISLMPYVWYHVFISQVCVLMSYQ